MIIQSFNKSEEVEITEGQTVRRWQLVNIEVYNKMSKAIMEDQDEFLIRKSEHEVGLETNTAKNRAVLEQNADL